jgi:hypothetical protein
VGDVYFRAALLEAGFGVGPALGVAEQDGGVAVDGILGLEFLVLGLGFVGKLGDVSRITSKCTTCNHFKVHHFGWVFSAGLRGWLAR